MSHVFAKVLELSFGASFLVLAVVIARFLLKKAPKWVRLLLWALVAVRLVLPIAPESPTSLVPDTAELTTSLESRLDAPILAPPAYQGSAVAGPSPNAPAADTVTPPVPDAAPAKAQGPSLLTVLAWVWVGGIAVMALATAVSYLRLRRKVATAVRLEGNVYQSEQVASPFILGLFRPRIYLPFSLGEASLSHVLAHEYAHLKRKDHLWKPLGFALLTAHWFNPLMWLGYVLLCRDIELACDERVVKGLDIQSRADYSQALLSSSVSRRSIAACPLAFGEIGVRQRIKSVLSYKKPAFWLILVALIACIAVAVCFLTDPPQTDGPAPQGALPEDIPEPYLPILSDYSAIVDFRLSEDFIEDYNKGVRPEISDTLADCMEDDLEYHFYCMLVEMAKGIDDLSEKSFGYILRDVNRDGSAELFLVRDDYTILASFTFHNGQVKMIDAFWPRHAMIVTEDGFLYTRSSSGADHTSFRLSKLEADGTLSEVVAFGTEGQAYYEISGGERKTIDGARFESLVSMYPFEPSDAWRGASIYTAIPECSMSGQIAKDDSLFLIEDTPENLASIQIPREVWIPDIQQELLRTFLLSQIEKNFDADFTLEKSASDVADKGRDYTGCYLEARPRVAYRSEQLISIVFEGMYNKKGAAHPIHFLWALNYDPQTLEALSFSQQYQVDGALYSAFSEAAEKEIRADCGGKWPEGWGSFAEEICSEERFLEGLSQEGDFHHYFTADGVVISFPVPYALGDHMEALLPYDCLTVKKPTPETGIEYTKITPVGQVPEAFKSIVQNNLFHGATAFGDRLLIAETTAYDEEGRATGHQVRMMDIYGRDLAEYTSTTEGGYHVSTLTATQDGGFLFVLGFYDYYDSQTGSYASEKGYASRVIKCDAFGKIQFDTAFEGIETTALNTCIEKNGQFYFFGTKPKPEPRRPGYNPETDVYMAVLDSRGNVLKTGCIAGSDFDSLHFAEAAGDEFLLSVRAQSDDGDFAGSTSGGYPAPWVFTVNDQLEITSRKMAPGRSYLDNVVGIKDGQPVHLSDPVFDNFDAGSPTAFIDYGDFYLIVSEHATGEYENTPLFISSIWHYWETVYSAYDNSGKLVFRSTVDSSPDYDAYVKSLG